MTTLTERQAVVLAYVIEHPGCRVTELATLLGSPWSTTHGIVITLVHRNFLEETQEGSPYVIHLWATLQGHAAFEHGSGQAETSGNIGPGLAQDGVVAVPALLPGDARSLWHQEKEVSQHGSPPHD